MISKKYYLSCQEDKKKQFKNYPASVLFATNLIEADELIVIGTVDNNMRKEILAAKRKKINIHYLNEKSIQTLDNFLQALEKKEKGISELAKDYEFEV